MNSKPNNIPGFKAEASLGPTIGRHLGKAVSGIFPSEGSKGVMPQLRFHLDMDGLAGYWRCRANGGSDLICRFFSGLPPFTIGGLMISR